MDGSSNQTPSPTRRSGRYSTPESGWPSSSFNTASSSVTQSEAPAAKPAMLLNTPNQDEGGVQFAGASAAHQGAKSRTPAAHGAEGAQPSAKGAAHNSAQQARKKADVLVLNLVATDDDGSSVQEEVEKWDATISDLMEKLHAAHKSRAAAFKLTQNNSARQRALDDDLEHANRKHQQRA